MDNKTPLRINDSDLELLAEPQRGTYVKPIAIGSAVLVLVGMLVLMTRTTTPVPAAVTSATPAVEPTPAEPVATPPAPRPDKPKDPVIAAAIETPHEEVVEKKPLTPIDHLRMARQLERQAQQNRRLAAQQYRAEAARYRAAARTEQRKAASNSRLANTYQKLALRSMRRGA